MLLIKSQVNQSLKKEILREHCFYSFLIQIPCQFTFDFAKHLNVVECNTSSGSKKFICTGNLLDWFHLFKGLTKYQYDDVQIYNTVFNELYNLDKDLFKQLKHG